MSPFTSLFPALLFALSCRNEDGKLGISLLQDEHLLDVALTRARLGLSASMLREPWTTPS